MSDGSPGVGELDPMAAVERDVDEAFATVTPGPVPNPPMGVAPNDGVMPPADHGPMGFVDSEETEPPPTRGDTQ
jgi:hypothetical protein